MMDRNPKLVVFRQASTVARKKLNEKVDELDKLLDEKRLVQKLYEEKENESRLQGSISRFVVVVVAVVVVAVVRSIGFFLSSNTVWWSKRDIKFPY
jgi:hypothetical protein